MTDTAPPYFLQIKESAQDFAHAGCRACTSGDSASRATWTIHLFQPCSGECGCVMLLHHADAVHDSNRAGDWTGRYDSIDQIGDPALRQHVQALLVAAHLAPPSGRP
ncbi:hypothetical protein ACU635_60920 [[Actinomadura] parvosata]|uniref:hypothetical protein n=1 Tax=[Actinomadura] parvosata TaxID=1955412 RepID=UPI00406D3FD8